MTEPNRDASSRPDQYGTNPRTSPPRRPIPGPGPRLPDPTLPHPGIFGQPSCRIPEPPAGEPLWEALRRLIDEHLGVRWAVEVQPERRAVVRKLDEPLRFNVSIDVTRPDAPYTTLVLHPVDDSDFAEKVESVLLEYRAEIRRTTELAIGYKHDINLDDPDTLSGFEISVLNRWKPIPPRSHEGRIARFLLWNIDVILWVRAQARAYGR